MSCHNVMLDGIQSKDASNVVVFLDLDRRIRPWSRFQAEPPLATLSAAAVEPGCGPEAYNHPNKLAPGVMGLWQKAAYASGTAGKFVFCHATANTEDKNGSPLKCVPYRMEHMPTLVEEAIRLSERENCYCAFNLRDPDLPVGKLGKYEDIIAPIGVVIELDRDKNDRIDLPRIIRPTAVVQTSFMPAQNLHYHYIFTRPLTPEEVKEMGELIAKRIEGDNNAANFVKPFRIPGTKNWPTFEKLEYRGRPSAPQEVKELEGDEGGSSEFVEPEDMLAAIGGIPLLPHIAKSQARQEAGGSRNLKGRGDRKQRFKNARAKAKANGHANGEDLDAAFDGLPEDLQDEILYEPPVTERSQHFQHVIWRLAHRLTLDQIIALCYGAPFAQKYEVRGNEQFETEIRRSYRKWEERNGGGQGGGGFGGGSGGGGGGGGGSGTDETDDGDDGDDGEGGGDDSGEQRGKKGRTEKKDQKDPPPKNDPIPDPTPTPKNGKRPSILVKGGKLSENADDAEKALRAAAIDVYRQRGELVRPMRILMRDSKRNEVQVPAIVKVSATYIRDLCCRHIDWEKLDGRSKKFVKIDAPKEIAETILHRKGEGPNWRTLAGVTGTPFLRRDGSIARKAGFDGATGMFLMDPVELPLDMPERPTKEDAKRALALLEELLLEFPFVDADQEPKFEDDEQATARRRATASFSVALSELLTPVARSAIDFAPMHANRAPVPGTGKSYLSDIASAIVNGTRCPVISAGKDEEELEKRLGSEILAGVTLIDIDNATWLSGSLLCQIVSQETVKPRILQKSETPPVSNVFSVLANGNNLQVSSELTRRTLYCLLDAWKNVEEVQSREFKCDPVAMVLADRGKYIAACLTILRAHHLAGYPCKPETQTEKPTPLNGFDDWSKVVRGALVWLGKTDPIKALEVGRNEDPERAEEEAFLTALHDKCYADTTYSARTLAQMAELLPTTPELKEALGKFIDFKGLDTRAAGKWLNKWKDKTLDGKALKSTPAGKGVMKWYVMDMNLF